MTRSVLRIVCLALLGVAQISVATAQNNGTDVDSAGLTIEAAAGWDGTIGRSLPVPVAFLISNSSERMIKGRLTLQDPLAGRSVTLGEVVVSPGATRRFASIQDLAEWYECFATLTEGTQVLWRRELALLAARDFNRNVNHVLVVDVSGRKPQLPGALSGTTAVPAEEQIPGKQGRPIQCLSAKPWQVPDHPGPLAAVQATIFPEGAADGDLNRVQWRAVADWLCQSGAVFVHKDSPEIIARLTDLAPLRTDEPAVSGEFVVRRVGFGAIYEYSRPLFASNGGEIGKPIAEEIAGLSRNHISKLIDMNNLYEKRGGRADLNRILVAIFFLMYTLLSGVVALLLFRVSRRQIAAFTLTVVIGASVLSGLLGGLLRFSRGDLNWVTVTQVGARGAVQFGIVDAQSAGGRNTRIAVHGERADLQFIGDLPRGYYRDPGQLGYPRFTWQQNLEKNVENTYQVQIPMSPWGRRQLVASGFTRDAQALDFQLDFERRDAPNDDEQAPPESRGLVHGVFSLKVVNHLPYDIADCWVFIGVTQKTTSQRVADPSENRLQGLSSAAEGMIDVYHVQQLPGLSAGTTHKQEFEASFRALNRWDRTLFPPRISRLGTVSAWIIGTAKNSSNLSIDLQRSEFVPHNELHLIIQEIRPENMPDASAFLQSGEAAN